MLKPEREASNFEKITSKKSIYHNVFETRFWKNRSFLSDTKYVHFLIFSNHLYMNDIQRLLRKSGRS